MYNNRWGLLIVFFFLVVHLSIINDYGLTWDFHHHFFAGLHRLGINPPPDTNLPFTEPDPRKTFNLPFGPIMSISPIITFTLFYQKLHILSFDNAYNLSSILWGVAGIGILYAFIKEAVGVKAGIFAALFLALTPRYFGDIHNNMKDIPQATIFALNIWLLWRLNKHKRPLDLILASLAFAVAFSIKVNSIFIPIIFLLWRPKNITYFLFAPLFAFALWSVFWQHPISQLLYIPSFFRDNTQNIEVLLFGKWYCSGLNVPWYYPLLNLGITTPIPILVFFFIGLIRPIGPISLMILWLLVPISRYVFPQMGVIDGVRHFEEVLFPLAAIAGIGISQIRLIRLIGPICIGLLLITIVSYHPYQITYYNELVGGVRGAYGKFDLDYWGTSQKEAVAWINEHAHKNASVFIVMAPDVAGRYLRPDLLSNLNKTDYTKADYTIVLNRQSFLYRYFYTYDYILTHTPVHTISVQGAPLVWIYDNKQKTERQTPWWKGEDPCIRKYW